MKKEEHIERILESTKGIDMPKADDFFYTRLSTRLETKQSIRNRVIIGLGILSINSLVILFVFSGTSNSAQGYSMDQATEQFAELYIDHVNFGLNESK